MKIEELIKESDILKIDDLHILKSEYGFDYIEEITRVTIQELEEIKTIIILQNKMSCKNLRIVDFLINIVKNKLSNDFINFQKIYSEFKVKNNLNKNDKVHFSDFKLFLQETNRAIDASDFLTIMSQIGKQTSKI